MPTLLRRLVALIKRNKLDDELREEIALHLAMRRQALIDAGMDPVVADVEARRLFGNATHIRETTRDARTFPSLASVGRDVRFGVRLLIRSPMFSLSVILTIALGAGLNGALFLLFNAALLRPPDVARAEEVVRLDDGKPASGATYPDYVDYRDRTGAAVDLAAYIATDVRVRLDAAYGRRTEVVTALLASGNYFDVLQVRAAIGRTFDGRDDLPPLGTPVVVIGESYWARQFNRDPAVVGQSFEINFQPFTVIGVLPAGVGDVRMPTAGKPFVPDLWVPLWCVPLIQPGHARLRERTTWWGMQVIGRLRTGVMLEQARAQLATVAASLDREYPGLRRPRAPWMAPISGFDVRLLSGELGMAVALMTTATMLVLLIASANVASLLLARACTRTREIAVRLSLGAGRPRIVRQFLTESLILSTAGTFLGFALAYAALRVVTSSAGASRLIWTLAPDVRVVGYALFLSALVAAITGIVPALQASKTGVLPALKDAAAGYRVGRLRAVFVGAEVALCLVFLVTTALLLRGVPRANAIDPVLPVTHLLSVSVGVVRDAPFVSLRARDEPLVFRAIDPADVGTVIVRTAGPAVGIARAAEAAVRAIDPNLEVSVHPVSDGIAEEVGGIRVGVGVAAALGALALILAVVGIGAVTAHAVTQRMHEIGVRMALGARGSDAVGLLVRSMLRPVAVGVAAGVVLTALVSRVIASQLYGLSAVDPVAFGVTSGLLMTVAAVAAYVPARRAARVDPLVALRCE